MSEADTRKGAQTPGDMMSTDATCRFFGGEDRPLHRATLWRGVKEGRYPQPIKLSPRMNRWLRNECEAKRRELIEARDEGGPLRDKAVG